ncbi:hypothetical protein FA13DRAFT_1317317 [Coprinellus micaceus]|uniref:Uncharacterized protein n=1 Tax=Coprinellus micaceus TaxID=71717 RepID=A0A4Y7SRA3_COPMI|nr:hypothetical protein FA13DRAFT_1317317 [Coprinellus micaceus]
MVTWSIDTSTPSPIPVYGCNTDRIEPLVRFRPQSPLRFSKTTKPTPSPCPSLNTVFAPPSHTNDPRPFCNARVGARETFRQPIASTKHADQAIAVEGGRRYHVSASSRATKVLDTKNARGGVSRMRGGGAVGKTRSRKGV